MGVAIFVEGLIALRAVPEFIAFTIVIFIAATSSRFFERGVAARAAWIICFQKLPLIDHYFSPVTPAARRSSTDT